MTQWQNHRTWVNNKYMSFNLKIYIKSNWEVERIWLFQLGSLGISNSVSSWAANELAQATSLMKRAKIAVRFVKNSIELRNNRAEPAHEFWARPPAHVQGIVLGFYCWGLHQRRVLFMQINWINKIQIFKQTYIRAKKFSFTLKEREKQERNQLKLIYWWHM